MPRAPSTALRGGSPARVSDIRVECDCWAGAGSPKAVGCAGIAKGLDDPASGEGAPPPPSARLSRRMLTVRLTREAPPRPPADSVFRARMDRAATERFLPTGVPASDLTRRSSERCRPDAVPADADPRCSDSSTHYKATPGLLASCFAPDTFAQAPTRPSHPSDSSDLSDWGLFCASPEPGEAWATTHPWSLAHTTSAAPVGASPALSCAGSGLFEIGADAPELPGPAAPAADLPADWADLLAVPGGAHTVGLGEGWEGQQGRRCRRWVPGASWQSESESWAPECVGASPQDPTRPGPARAVAAQAQMPLRHKAHEAQ